MSQKMFNNALKALETQWLKKNKFIAGEHVTIADFSAYVEIAQLNTQFTNLFDYSNFENLTRWLDDMSKLPYHDDVHMVLTKMGDISETVPEMEIIMKANLETFSHLNEIVYFFHNPQDILGQHHGNFALILQMQSYLDFDTFPLVARIFL